MNARELIDSLAALPHETARERVGRERVAIQPTQVLASEPAKVLTGIAGEADSNV